MQLTKEQFIRDFKDTLHEEQLIRVPRATPAELFTTLAKLVRKYYTNIWIDRNQTLSEKQEKSPTISQLSFYQGVCLKQTY